MILLVRAWPTWSSAIGHGVSLRTNRTPKSRPLPIALRHVLRLIVVHHTNRDAFMQAAFEEAKAGLAEGGIPIGSVLVIDGAIAGRGHNRRIQNGSAILHAEMDAIENAGRRKASEYRRAILYSTLSPCDMCAGTALLYKIPRIVIGENRTLRGPEDYMRSRGVVLDILDDPECVRLMEEFIRARPELWHEDIGE
jgi:cytosine deaminase